jgi:hypothetical protein
MRTSIAPVRWHRFRLAETDASDFVSAACYRGSEHVGIVAVVITELKLRDVQRQIFSAHLVERTDYAALEDRPEAFNRVGVNRADNVLVLVVIDHGVRVVAQVIAIAAPRVGRQQADFVRKPSRSRNRACLAT